MTAKVFIRGQVLEAAKVSPFEATYLKIFLNFVFSVWSRDNNKCLMHLKWPLQIKFHSRLFIFRCSNLMQHFHSELFIVTWYNFWSWTDLHRHKCTFSALKVRTSVCYRRSSGPRSSTLCPGSTYWWGSPSPLTTGTPWNCRSPYLRIPASTNSMCKPQQIMSMLVIYFHSGFITFILTL